VPAQRARTDFRDQQRRTYLPASENSAKGADGYTNEAGDNASSYLYSPSDQAKARLRIVGDPAWMQQGEVSAGISATNFNFSPFNDDGTINYDSQEVVFDISWNAPTDYDFNTGLMDLNRSNYKPDGSYSTQPQNNFTYTAIKCKNIFSKGRFEQELEGRLLVEFEKNKQATDAGRPKGNDVATTGNTRPGNTTNAVNSDWIDMNGFMVSKDDVTPDQSVGQEDGAPQLLNSPDPLPPTSDASIDTYDAGLADATQPGTADSPVQQNMNRDT
jgi:hypothetical protein